MSLQHVPEERRLEVSLDFLRAINDTIKRGKLDPGLPLYPDSTSEFFDEVLSVGAVLAQQAALIKELQEETRGLRELQAKAEHERKLSSARAHTRLEQLSQTLTPSTSGDEHETEESNRHLSGDRAGAAPAGTGERPRVRRERAAQEPIRLVVPESQRVVREVNDWNDF